MSDTVLLSRSEQKRRQILLAGRTLFMAQGFADTSMDQVTAKSGVSKATVYNHFPSKEKLFEEAVRTHAEEVFAALPELDAEHKHPEEMLTQYFHALLQILLSEDGACMCFLLMSEGRRFPENARLIYETGFGRGLAEMARYLTQLDHAGSLKVPDPDWAAMRLLGLVMPPLPMMCAGFTSPVIPSVEEVRKSIRLFLKGMDADN
ncbi:MAG: TetR/AcrR family transcriptional regulator [Planctomyces sp.]|jgi:TetR/AcrR family transcriptional repressor of mexJK operon